MGNVEKETVWKVSKVNSDPCEISPRSDPGKGEEDFYLFPHLSLIPPMTPDNLLILLVDYMIG